jgi:hypothetical protein
MPAIMKHSTRLVVLLLFAFSCLSVRANLVITPTFDASIIGNANAATIENSINAAIAQLQGAINNSITVLITFQDTNSGLGASNTSFSNLAYSTYRSDLATNQTLSANDTTALASLPPGPNNPVNGDTDVTLTLPLLRAIGEAALGSNGGTADSTISLNLSQMNLSRGGAQDPNKYDLEQVALHEINEVLGAGGAGSILPTTTGPVGSLDLFRYSAAGTRSFSSSGRVTSYFSINGGVTSLSRFNQDGTGDYADWDGTANGFSQVQDAFANPGLQLNEGTNELTSLDVIGYNIVPEPATFYLAAFGLLAILVRFQGRRLEEKR